MGADRWFAEPDPDVLGVVVHGPALVARATGIAVGVRCVLARPDALEIDVVVRASGVQAEAASRQSFGHGERLGSEPTIEVELDGRRGVAQPMSQTSSGGDDEFASERRIVVPGLPSDGSFTLTASWPEAGLAAGSVTLTLDSLADLEARVVRLTV